MTFGIRVHHPPPEALTVSQRDVVIGAYDGFKAVSETADGNDLAVILAPFQMRTIDVAQGARAAVTVHSEDPYALSVNRGYVRELQKVVPDTWVVTNEVSCAVAYGDLVGDRVISCPSLSVPAVAPLPNPVERSIDVLIVGYGYPSRRRVVDELAMRFPMERVTLVGDGWGRPSMRTMSTPETLALYAKARAVVCLHRQDGDCGPGRTIHVARGYVEGCGGARVFIDKTRTHHPFADGEVEWFDDARDLAAKLDRFLSLSDIEQRSAADLLYHRTYRDFTYRARMEKIVNCIRSSSHNTAIP